MITLFILCSAISVTFAAVSSRSDKPSRPATRTQPTKKAEKAPSLNITITADSVGVSISADGQPETIQLPADEEILIPERPVSVSTSPPDTVFEHSLFKNGSLTAEDSLGREWEYDNRLRAFRLRWEQVRSSGTGREGMVFISDDDTVIVSRDRDPDWAQSVKRVRRANTKKIHVRADEYVPRSITGARKVTIDGLVEGDVISLKEVVVGPTGVIDGDVSAPVIKVRSGGLITGAETEVVGDLEFTREFGNEYRRVIDFGAIPIFVGLASLLILIAFVSLSVAPNAVSRTSEAISSNTWTTIWVGLVSIMALPIVLSVLCVTIVGIPLAVIAALAMVVAIPVGIVAYSQYSGRAALAAYGVEDSTHLRKIVVGILILIGLWTLAFALQASRAEFLASIGVVLLIISILFSAVAVLAGIGGVALTRFGRREYTRQPGRGRSGYPPPPSPPPTPKPPAMPPLPQKPDASTQSESPTHPSDTQR